MSSGKRPLIRPIWRILKILHDPKYLLYLGNYGSIVYNDHVLTVLTVAQVRKELSKLVGKELGPQIPLQTIKAKNLRLACRSDKSCSLNSWRPP